LRLPAQRPGKIVANSVISGSINLRYPPRLESPVQPVEDNVRHLLVCGVICEFTASQSPPTPTVREDRNVVVVTDGLPEDRTNIHPSPFVLVLNPKVDTHLLSLGGWKAEST